LLNACGWPRAVSGYIVIKRDSVPERIMVSFIAGAGRKGGWPMPWTAESFRSKHNKKLTPEQAQEAAKIANAILRDTGDEAKAIRIANYEVGKKKK
jgi:hypothetical protein